MDHSTPDGFPGALRTWRRARRLSQLHLALEADVSARHLSFLETGRAQPSREMVERLGGALRLPLAAQNRLLLQAGFAARYPTREWGADEMAPVRAAIAHTLDRHAPYPALALDRLWRVVQLNGPARALFGLLGVAEGDSLLDRMGSEGMLAHIENWPEVAHHAAQRLWTESAAQGGVPELDRAAEQLSRTPRPRSAPPGPVIPTVFVADGLRLALFATVAQFGTPHDVTLDDLKIELYFPADRTTDAALRAWPDTQGDR